MREFIELCFPLMDVNLVGQASPTARSTISALGSVRFNLQSTLPKRDDPFIKVCQRPGKPWVCCRAVMSLRRCQPPEFFGLSSLLILKQNVILCFS
jgi:hypothetical protein